jgi:hypothetical protein
MNHWIMRLNNWIINRPYIDHTSTPHRTYIDPTSTLHRPYIDPTSTPHRPHIDPTSTLDRPHIDPTSTLHRPYINPTSTLHRPYIDPTSHVPICRRKNINVFKPFILGHLWLNFQNVNMPYKHKRDCPLCNKPGLRCISDHLRQVQNMFSFEHISFLWSFCEASVKLL